MRKLDPHTQLLVGVGNCLDAWNSVELEIANLYMILHRIKRNEYSHPIRSAYESVISLEVRLALINGYVEADIELRDDYLPHLKSLTSRITKLYKKRHEAAHFKIIAHVEKEVVSYTIRPYFTWSTFISNECPELNAQQLNERAEKFHELTWRVVRHIQHIGAQRNLPAEFYAQAGDIIFPPLGPEDLTPTAPVTSLSVYPP